MARVAKRANTEFIDKGYERVKKNLENLEQMKLYIFIDDKATYRNGEKVEVIASIMEYGQEEYDVHIPARPFWRSTFTGRKKSIKKRFEKNVFQIVNGNMSARQCLEDLGEYCVQLVKDTIIRGRFEPLSPVTIRAKGSDIILIDTKKLINSIKYEIEVL